MEENETYGDILMVDMVDHYNNLTLKTMHMLKFFNDLDKLDGQIPKILIKVDDDVFLNLPLLIEQLSGKEFTVEGITTNTTDKWMMGFKLGEGKQSVNKIPRENMNQAKIYLFMKIISYFSRGRLAQWKNTHLVIFSSRPRFEYCPTPGFFP